MQLDWPKISSCADGSEGERLLIANSLKTFNLNPEHTYVPWIVIDKNHTKQMQTGAETNLLQFLCDNYFNHVSNIFFFCLFRSPQFSNSFPFLS